ncbi:MAG: cbb3-type cytochrome oxidase assembly protein CcoS [Colwellia sp.]
MSIIYILIPVAIVFTALGIYLFFWAVKTEQFDDLEKQGMSILFDEKDKNDELVMSSNEKHNKLEIESSKGNKEINKKSSGKE